jgi:hypothetical protein
MLKSILNGRSSMKYLLWILIIFVFINCVSSATAGIEKSNGRIDGKIISTSGSPLRDAIITIQKEVEEGEAITIAKSDSRGLFRSTDLAPGVYFLQIIHKGYQPAKTKKFIIYPGLTISLDIVLHEFMGLLSRDEDPRNWDLNSVMRSTSDRRMIFRNTTDKLQINEIPITTSFQRSGAMRIASGIVDGNNYLIPNQTSPTGVTSNFALSEPVSRHSRMIISGQVDYGYGTFWRLRNTYNYQPDRDHDYRISVGYGRMNVNPPGSNLYNNVMSQDKEMDETGVQTLAVGFEGKSNFLDLVSVKYGFDYSRLHHGGAQKYFLPSIQIVINPADGFSIKSSLSTRHLSDMNSIILPDGEILDLSEPTLITMFGNKIKMSQVTHSEISVYKNITDDTTIEFAVYQDRTQGPGLPIMITAITPTERKTQIVEINNDQSKQRGLRVALKRKINDNLNGSVSYVFGNTVNVTGISDQVAFESLGMNLEEHLQLKHQHAITGSIDARLPITRTKLMATLRWYPGNQLTPIDWFSDRMDIGAKSANFEIRQMIPLPQFLGSSGPWEVLIDLRNILNQGKEVLAMNDGEIILNRNPRSLRFGLSLSFH